MTKHSSDLYPIGFKPKKEPDDRWVYIVLAFVALVLTVIAYSLFKL